MTRFRFTFILILGMVLYGGTASLQEQNVSEGGTVEGRIIETTPLERPISDVEVIFVRADGTEFETESDEKGEYKRPGLPPGRYLVSIYKPGYEDRMGKPVSVVDGGLHYVPLTMNKKENIVSAFQNLLRGGGKRGGVLRFWVHSRVKPIVPIGGVEIKITGDGLNAVDTGVSDANGQYRSGYLPPGRYMGTIGKDNDQKVFPITVYSNRITDARVNLSISNGDANLPPTRKKGMNVILGKIRDTTPFEPPIPGVRIVIKSAEGIEFEGISDADGAYEYTGLSEGRYLISLHKEGYVDQEGIPIIVAKNKNDIVAVIEEGMFVSYAVVASGGLLELTHGMRKK